jgi:hypothetical protein
MSGLGDDIMDSRDLDDELDAMIDAGPGQDLEDIATRRTLRQLKAETEGEGWRHGIMFIRETYFETYARELAEDVGLLSDSAKWPGRCIDWEQAAEELQMDYTSTEVDGVTYYYQPA